MATAKKKTVAKKASKPARKAPVKKAAPAKRATKKATSKSVAKKVASKRSTSTRATSTTKAPTRKKTVAPRKKAVARKSTTARKSTSARKTTRTKVSTIVPARSLRSSVVVPEVPLQPLRTPERSQASLRSSGSLATSSAYEASKPSSGGGEGRKNAKVLFFLLSFLIVAGAVVSKGISSNSIENAGQPSTTTQSPSASATPTPSPTPSSSATETSMSSMESESFGITYLYNSTGIRIYLPSNSNFTSVQKTTLLMSKNGASYAPLLSSAGEAKTFKVVKIDTVGQTKFVVELTLKDGSTVKSSVLSVPGEFAQE